MVLPRVAGVGQHPGLEQDPRVRGGLGLVLKVGSGGRNIALRQAQDIEPELQQ